jgi:hypothetical protein
MPLDILIIAGLEFWKLKTFFKIMLDNVFGGFKVNLSILELIRCKTSIFRPSTRLRAMVFILPLALLPRLLMLAATMVAILECALNWKPPALNLIAGMTQLDNG